MKARLGSMIALVLFAGPAFAQKITIDYDHDYDFDKVKTFTYVSTDDTNSKDQLMDGRIKDAIIRELTEGGLQQVVVSAPLEILSARKLEAAIEVPHGTFVDIAPRIANPLVDPYIVFTNFLR